MRVVVALAELSNSFSEGAAEVRHVEHRATLSSDWATSDPRLIVTRTRRWKPCIHARFLCTGLAPAPEFLSPKPQPSASARTLDRRSGRGGSVRNWCRMTSRYSIRIASTGTSRGTGTGLPTRVSSLRRGAPRGRTTTAPGPTTSVVSPSVTSGPPSWMTITSLIGWVWSGWIARRDLLDDERDVVDARRKLLPGSQAAPSASSAGNDRDRSHRRGASSKRVPIADRVFPRDMGSADPTTDIAGVHRASCRGRRRRTASPERRLAARARDSAHGPEDRLFVDVPFGDRG